MTYKHQILLITQDKVGFKFVNSMLELCIYFSNESFLRVVAGHSKNVLQGNFESEEITWVSYDFRISTKLNLVEIL